MTTCPVCDNAVDPLRSRFVSVREGKVVAYCSAACLARQAAEQGETEAAAAQGRAGAVPAAPAAAPPPAATAGAATLLPTATAPAQPAAAPPHRAESEAAASGVPGPPRPGTPAPGVPAFPDSGPVIEVLHEPASGVVTSARDARIEPRARHPDEIPIAAFWSADQEKSAASRAAGAADGAASASDRGATPATPAPAAPGDGEARAPALVEDTPEAAPRARRLPLLLLILVLVGAGGFLVYRFLLRDGLAAAIRPGPGPGAQATAQATSLAPAARVEAPRPVRPSQPRATALDGDAAVEQARAALRHGLAATSRRVRRLAAAALARTQDREACEVLAAQIGVHGAHAQGRPAGGDAIADGPADEPATSEIARLDLAYALARGGDRRGSDVLAGSLGAPRAEARDEAARLLALLGDRRAVPHLVDLLAVSQRRLGAAEHLAHLAEPHAVSVLDHVRGDPRASADDRARATVALGIAGRREVAAALREMLGDPHFNAFAAAALAALDDRAARPVLERQLASSPLRVLAARALRRLDPALDPRPLLPALLEVVRSGRDIDQIPAAEAILLLAGPASWSAYD